MEYIKNYFGQASQIISKIDFNSVQKVINLISKVKEAQGRIFFIGVGGSAANASHAVNDFRKILNIQSYAPSDNVAELTARVNDDGWDSAYSNWLKVSRLSRQDLVFVLSVGGGNHEKKISVNLIESIKYAKQVGASIAGIVGRDGGFTAKSTDAHILIPTVDPMSVTPHTEAFQMVILHLIVSHPSLKVNEMKWESEQKPLP